MAGIAHIVYGLTRWPGKPTSGRFVYKSRIKGGWYWQCDLHNGDEAQPDQHGDIVPTMQEAFAGALAHALVCTGPTDLDEPEFPDRPERVKCRGCGSYDTQRVGIGSRLIAIDDAVEYENWHCIDCDREWER